MDIIEKFLNNNIAEKGIIKLIILKYLSSKNADAITNSSLTVYHFLDYLNKNTYTRIKYEEHPYVEYSFSSAQNYITIYRYDHMYSSIQHVVAWLDFYMMNINKYTIQSQYKKYYYVTWET